MAKIIRPTYPREFSIGLLLIIFVLSSFLSFAIFSVKWRELMEGKSPVLGMALAGLAVVFMALILWEEFLFPVRIKPSEDEIVFRNHATKLRTQVLIYCVIPVIVGFIYFNYKIDLIPFVVWAGVCLIPPVAGKIASGVKNYNDFLKLTNDTIEYKNNQKGGTLPVRDIQQIILIKDEVKVLHKVQVRMVDNNQIIIDLDEMELDEYCVTIETFVKSHYKGLVK